MALALCAVEVSAVSAVRTLKQRKLEEVRLAAECCRRRRRAHGCSATVASQRIQRTEFGKSMLSAVKAQLRAGTDAKSFDLVQDFIDQVYKRVEFEQSSEASLHDQRMEECKMKLSQLIQQSHDKARR